MEVEDRETRLTISTIATRALETASSNFSLEVARGLVENVAIRCLVLRVAGGADPNHRSVR